MTPAQRDEIVAAFLAEEGDGDCSETCEIVGGISTIRDKLRSLLAMEAKAREIRDNLLPHECRECSMCGERRAAAEILAAGQGDER